MKPPVHISADRAREKHVLDGIMSGDPVTIATTSNLMVTDRDKAYNVVEPLSNSSTETPCLGGECLGGECLGKLMKRHSTSHQHEAEQITEPSPEIG